MARRYGLIRDTLDPRDRPFRGVATSGPLPPKLSLRSQMPPALDQGDIASASANAVASVFRYEQVRRGDPPTNPSRLFLYYNARVLEHSVESDAGAQIRSVLKALAAQGVCDETIWPYDPANLAVEPSSEACRLARLDAGVEYWSVPLSAAAIRTALVSGYPVLIGTTVFEDFEGEGVARSGRVGMPQPNATPLGGHSMVIVGYDMTLPGRPWEVLNSRGPDWGQDGCAWVPEPYLVDPALSSDFWVMRRTTVAPIPESEPEAPASDAAPVPTPKRRSSRTAPRRR